MELGGPEAGEEPEGEGGEYSEAWGSAEGEGGEDDEEGCGGEEED